MFNPKCDSSLKYDIRVWAKEDRNTISASALADLVSDVALIELQLINISDTHCWESSRCLTFWHAARLFEPGKSRQLQKKVPAKYQGKEQRGGERQYNRPNL